jgi:hypothetical protein
MDYHRLFAILRSHYFGGANPVRGNDSYLAQRTSSGWVRDGTRRAGTCLYRRIHCLAWYFALAGRVLGTSDLEKIPIARLDSSDSFNSSGALLSVPYEAWEELMVRIAGPGSHGNDFLIQAAAQDKRRFVTLLLSKGYDINYENQGGTTPLSGTSVGGHEKMIRFLISRGADVNRKDRLSGETPLTGAAEMGQLGSVKVLLENGADPCLTDKEGHTAEGRAKEYHHNYIAEYLSSRFHCSENVINPPCVDSAFSACVHP